MHKFTKRGAWALAGLCVALCASAASASALNVEVVNDSGQPAGNVYLMLDGGSSSDGQLIDDVPKQLSELNNSGFVLGSISAGRLYVSFGASVKNNEPPQAPTRYDKIELSNPGVADVTAVDFLGIPFGLQSLDSAGAGVGAAVAYSCYTSTILQKLRAIAPSAEVTSGGQFVRFLSPQLAPESYPSMAPYVESMAGQTITVEDIYAHEGEPTKTLHYAGTFASDGSIELSGTIEPTGSAAAAGLPLHIEGSTLPSAIYTGNGSYTVGGAAADVSQNNQYSVIYRDIVAGFALGYWGGRYGNDTAAWLHQPDFAAARNGSAPYPTYSLYASTIAEYAPVYGYSFSELGPGNVTVPLEPSVATLRLTIDPDQGPSAPGCEDGATSPITPQLSAPSPRTSGPLTASRPGSSKAKGASSAAGKLTIRSGAATLDKRGRAPLTLSCAGGPCDGELTLDRVYKVHQRPPHGRGEMGRTIERTVVLGRATFSIAAGKSERVLVPFGVAARRRIAVVGRRRLSVVAEAIVGPRAKKPTVTRRGVMLESYTPPPRRHRRGG